MDPTIKIGNTSLTNQTAVDLLTLVPVPLAIEFLTFFSPQEVVMYKRVSKAWYKLINNEDVWRIFARQLKIKRDAQCSLTFFDLVKKEILSKKKTIVSFQQLKKKIHDLFREIHLSKKNWKAKLNQKLAIEYKNLSQDSSYLFISLEREDLSPGQKPPSQHEPDTHLILDISTELEEVRIKQLRSELSEIPRKHLWYGKANGDCAEKNSKIFHYMTCTYEFIEPNLFEKVFRRVKYTKFTLNVRGINVDLNSYFIIMLMSSLQAIGKKEKGIAYAA